MGNSVSNGLGSNVRRRWHLNSGCREFLSGDLNDIGVRGSILTGAPTFLKIEQGSALMQGQVVSPECHRIGSPPRRSPLLRLLLSAAAILTVGASWPALAQVQQESFSFPVGLDPYGDNFLALRSLPSGTEGVRLARLGPDTLFTELGRQGGWVNIRLASGQTGWVSARYVGCCRTAAPGRSAPSEPASSACEDLWSERNAIFKAAGYCFRTPQAIRAFGNAGCRFDDEADVPLSIRQREQVAQIRATERRLGCAR